MKTLALILGLTLAGNNGYAFAASHEHDMQHDMSSHATQPATHAVKGVVKAVKPGKLQIAHEPVPALEWPQMTMWFRLDGPMPHGIKAGDRVRFEMKQGADRQWGIVKVEKD